MSVVLNKIEVRVAPDKLAAQVEIIPADENQHKLLSKLLEEGVAEVIPTSVGDRLSFDVAFTAKKKKARTVAEVVATAEGPKDGV